MWRDNIPLISILLLRGRCRSCAALIPLYVSVAEGVGALTCALLVWRFSWGELSVLFMVFFGLMLAASLIDIYSLWLPDTLLVAGFAPVLLLLVRGELAPWPEPFYASLVGGGLLFLLRAVHGAIRKQEGLGLGDVKLMALLGLLTSVAGVFDILFFAALVGLIVAGMLRWIQGRMPELMPFGPFLCLGAFAKVLWGGHGLLMG